MEEIPESLGSYALERDGDGHSLVYTYDRQAERTGIRRLLNDLDAAGLHLSDVRTRESSLEEIFVGLVKETEA